MKKQVYAIFDSKIGAFCDEPPLFLHSHGEAIRGWTSIANDTSGKNLFSIHPEDFSLMHIGEFDHVTGLLAPVVPPTNLGMAASFKKQPSTQAPLFDGLKAAN